MKYKLIVTKGAQSELESIADYIAESLCNPLAALDFLDDIKKCYDLLSDNPLIYQVCDNLGNGEEYRKAVIKNYLLIYRVDKNDNSVNILHFFYGRRDYFDLI